MRQVNPETGMIDFPPHVEWKHRQPRAKPGELEAALKSGVEAATDECIIWPFSIDQMGYAVIRSRRLLECLPSQHVHRVVCIAAHGPAPHDRPLATHRCGNRPCINRQHLKWGNAKENMDDMIAHGRDQNW
jgi:hypothetical protein